MTAVRIDKWLWAARFFKTRSLAQAAVRGGHVEINGHGCKPARTVSGGDQLRIVRGETVFELEVLAVSERRGPASEARELYEESASSVAERARRVEQRRLEADHAPDGRPGKRDRRRIRAFSGKG